MVFVYDIFDKSCLIDRGGARWGANVTGEPSLTFTQTYYSPPIHHRGLQRGWNSEKSKTPRFFQPWRHLVHRMGSRYNYSWSGRSYLSFDTSLDRIGDKNVFNFFSKKCKGGTWEFFFSEHFFIFENFFFWFFLDGWGSV